MFQRLQIALTLEAHAILLAEKLFTCAYQHQIALEIMLWPLQISYKNLVL